MRIESEVHVAEDGCRGGGDHFERVESLLQLYEEDG